MPIVKAEFIVVRSAVYWLHAPVIRVEGGTVVIEFTPTATLHLPVDPEDAAGPVAGDLVGIRVESPVNKIAAR